MRCVYLGAFVCLMAMGCSNESVEQVIENQEVSDSALVRVRIENFAVTMEEEGGNVGRRAQSVDSYGDLNAVTLAFYDAENKEVFKQEQLRDLKDLVISNSGCRWVSTRWWLWLIQRSLGVLLC